MLEKAIDWELYREATADAEVIVDEILKGLNNPTYTISGEARVVYQELDMFRWFEDKPLTDTDNRSFYIRLISMQQYRHLSWKIRHKKDKKNDRKLSKWEKVMGAVD